MMESIHLDGASDVRQAANTMRDAALEIRQANSYLAETMHNQQQFMNDWLERFEAALKRLNPPLQAEPQTTTPPSG